MHNNVPCAVRIRLPRSSAYIRSGYLSLNVAYALLHLVVPRRQRSSHGLLGHHRHLVLELLQLVPTTQQERHNFVSTS
jgi:hypothetical protein